VALKELHTPDIKISEAILSLCEPLRKKYKDNNLKVIISITVMAWNISLFAKEEQAEAQKLFFRTLLKDLKVDDVPILLAQIKVLIERKNRDYPGVREYILKNTLTFSGDTFTLTVETADVPDEIRKREPSITSPKGSYNFKA